MVTWKIGILMVIYPIKDISCFTGFQSLADIFKHTKIAVMKQHLLLIDDDKDELTIFMDALREVPHEDGFKCTYASSTRQAIEMLKFLVPDFIFVDFNIPKMNGLEFIAFITGQPQLKKTKLCLYSMNINEEIDKQAKSLGACCIKKSGTIEALAKNLSAVLVPNHSLVTVFRPGDNND